MPTKMFHWCPSGCGKSAIYDPLEHKNDNVKNYICRRCNKRYTRTQMIKHGNNLRRIKQK